MLAHAPLSATSVLIQSASYPRSANSIDPDFRRDSSLLASRLSCASPAVSASRTGRPLVSTKACILLVRPPLDRRIMGNGQRIHDPSPDASPSPANEAIVAGGVWAELMWQIAPWCARS